MAICKNLVFGTFYETIKLKTGPPGPPVAEGQEVFHESGGNRIPIALTNKPIQPDWLTGQTHRLTLTLFVTNFNHL